MNWRIILWPFSLIYGSITALRNLAFTYKILPSKSYKTPIISVGNLNTGGTGKTPMVEFLLQNLSYTCAMLSRGYGRKTKGYIEANHKSTAREIGDEPLQISRKYSNVQVAVCEKRVFGIEQLIKKYQPEVILLDDAFQHRYVKPHFQILLTTYQKPFFRDFVLPAGDLRESAKGKKRAQAIVITKCPKNLSQKEAFILKQKIKPHSQQEIFFTTTQYASAKNYEEQDSTIPNKEPIIALTGIARPKPFIAFLNLHFTIHQHLQFNDHYNFTHNDIEQITNKLEKFPHINLVTTEKDWIRLKPLWPSHLKHKIFYIPIKIVFLFNGEKQFLSTISKQISKL